MISIHALLAESDLLMQSMVVILITFLSTLSLRRATWLRCWKLAARDISIHALLAESDLTDDVSTGGKIISIHALLAESDVTVLGIQHKVGISIHALLAESDSLRSAY